MKYHDILIRIKACLDTLYPPGDHIHQLSQLLELNPRSIRRKLSGESQFTIYEIIKIANFHSISLSEMLDDKKKIYEHPMYLFIWDYAKPEEFETIMKKTIDIFLIASQAERSFFLHTNNFIPGFTFYNNKKLIRFFSLKWLYYNRPPEKMKNYSDMNLYSVYENLQKTVLQSIKNLHMSKYIFHENFFRNSIVDLILFYKKGFINREEYLELLEEFKSLLHKFT